MTKNIISDEYRRNVKIFKNDIFPYMKKHKKSLNAMFRDCRKINEDWEYALDYLWRTKTGRLFVRSMLSH